MRWDTQVVSAYSPASRRSLCRSANSMRPALDYWRLDAAWAFSSRRRFAVALPLRGLKSTDGSSNYPALRRAVHRVLRPGGVLALSQPHYAAPLPWALRHLWYGWQW